jgi:starch synthase
MSKVLMIASEAAPFAKTGGLADVLGSLPRALVERGEEVAVVMPRYRSVSLEGAWRAYSDLTVWLGATPWEVNIFRIDYKGTPYYFVDCPSLYDRDGIYGDEDGDYRDNHIRFAVLSHAALALIRHVWRPEIVHGHDWQAAFAPIYMRHFFAMDPTFLGLRVLFTVHNLGYQGKFPPSILPEVGLDETAFRSGALEFFGEVNLLKGALVYADAISTVSQGYAREIQSEEFGFGLQDILRARANALHGILNGVDYTVWSPDVDSFIACRYSSADLSGKAVCKRDLLAEVGLPEDNMDRPLIGMISRFVNQKGFDLIAAAAEDLAALDIAMVVLGAGDARYEELIRGMAAAHPERIACWIGYNDPLAHKIEAGADMFLMPSWYEPCGMNQLYSLRYGTVPIVRATGGLDDSVDETTGFKFREYSAPAMMGAVRAAVGAWKNRDLWRSLMLRGMEKDFSWAASAAKYSDLYRSLLS